MCYYRIRNVVTGDTIYGSAASHQTMDETVQKYKQNTSTYIVEPLTYSEYHAEVDKIFVDN
jgi:hypothetical protein